MKKIALIGQANTGKSSLYNLISGQNQPTGNYAGITVSSIFTLLNLPDGTQAKLIDFPGTYSVFPSSEDERVVQRVLNDPEHENYPDLLAVVVNSTQLQKSIQLFLQLQDFGIPMVLLLNMSDKLRASGKKINYEKLQALFPQIVLIPCNARLQSDKKLLLQKLAENLTAKPPKGLYGTKPYSLGTNLNQQKKYLAFHNQKAKEITTEVVEELPQKQANFTLKMDRLFVHPIWGYGILLLILLGIFQVIFSFAALPMDLIDDGINQLAYFINQQLPNGMLNQLLTQGIIPGIGGIVMFIPQIALLFFFIALLEESGYMSRVVFLLDRLMRPFGLSGKSVVPLLSSVACAIPGILSARTIPSEKSRLITILVAPFMSCSARIPVYLLIISLIIPAHYIGGIISVQAIVLLLFYVLGLLAALGAAWILNKGIKERNADFLLMEMPNYGMPSGKNTLLTVWYKSKEFIFGAGKIILSMSVVLWFLGSFGPSSPQKEAELQTLVTTASNENWEEEKLAQESASVALTYSYLGRLGKGIEPLIEPLGYNWKMGIALLSSFAAREVFVSTLSTIYSLDGAPDPDESLIEKLREDTHADGSPVYHFASGISLMLFYAFAMQCMATFAVVKKETNSWKWALYQLIGMGILAYLAALISFQLLK